MKRLAFALAFLAASLVLQAEETQGIVQPIKTVSVSSNVLQDIISAMLVEEGDEVKEGQIIVKLLEEKETLAVEQGQKVVELREFTAKGAKALLDEKMGSKDQALKAQTELESAKIELKLAKVRLDEKTIRAPIAGIVVKKWKESGESVERVEKLVDIVNIDQVYVQFYLDPKLMTVLKEEQTVAVKFPVIGDKVFTGKISFVDPRIDASSNLFRVKVLVDNKDRTIKSGMRGTADFTKLAK